MVTGCDRMIKPVLGLPHQWLYQILGLVAVRLQSCALNTTVLRHLACCRWKEVRDYVLARRDELKALKESSSKSGKSASKAGGKGF